LACSLCCWLGHVPLMQLAGLMEMRCWSGCLLGCGPSSCSPLTWLVAELGWLPLPACKPPAVSCHTGLPACAGWPACWPSSLLGPLLRWPANAAARPERSRPAPPKRAHARLPPPLSASPSAGSRRACWPSASHALVRGRKRPGACSCKLHLPLRFWTD